MEKTVNNLLKINIKNIDNVNDYCIFKVFNDNISDEFSFSLEYLFEWVEERHYEWFIKHVISKKLNIDIETEMIYIDTNSDKIIPFADVISIFKKIYLTKK